MQISNRLKSNQVIKTVIAIFIVLIAGGAGYFVLKNKIEASAKKIYESRSMLRVLENRDENYSFLKVDYPLVKDGLPVLRKALPGEDSLDEVVNSLDALASETNNTQNLVFDSLASTETIGSTKSVNFSASLDGNFGTFENYFKKLDNLPYFIEIGNFNISNGLGIFNNDSRLSFKGKLYIKN